jgi:hypothetical protein
MTNYKIIRFRFEGRPRVVARGLSLAQAQQHCKDPRTHKLDKQGNVVWFDGYDKE